MLIIRARKCECKPLKINARTRIELVQRKTEGFKSLRLPVPHPGNRLVIIGMTEYSQQERGLRVSFHSR